MLKKFYVERYWLIFLCLLDCYWELFVFFRVLLFLFNMIYLYYLVFGFVCKLYFFYIVFVVNGIDIVI